MICNDCGKRFPKRDIPDLSLPLCPWCAVGLPITEREHAALHRTPRAVPSNEPTKRELAALKRLVAIGHGYSGQCVRVRSFLLAWWNAGEQGGFDLVDLWSVDKAISDDMLLVCAMIARVLAYPDGNPRLPNLRSDMEAFIARKGGQ